VSSNLTPSAMAKILDLRKKQEISAETPSKKLLKKESPSSPVKTSLKAEAKIPSSLPYKQPPQITWQAPSFYFNPHKKYLSLIIIALALGGGGLLFFGQDTLTSIFLLLSSLVLVLYSTKRPEISKVVIDQRGVAIGDIIYYYKDLRSFWINYDPNNLKELSLESKKWYLPYITVSLENKNPLVIRSMLINFMPEKEHEHSLVDIIARKIGL
jgi:hypothetical protein